VTLGAPTQPSEPPPGDYVMICVRDTGAGMSDQIRAKVFEPFFTTKEIGKGSGLGLSQVLGFAKQSSGGVRIESQPGEGTSVCIYLPRAEPQSPRAASLKRARSGHQPANGSVILLVDDDHAVREITAATLRSLGHIVIEAGSGGAALDILDHDRSIELAVIDFAMPGMNGAEVARQAQARRPALPVLFVTGFADRAALAGVSETQIVGKPFQDEELADKLSALLASVMGVRPSGVPDCIG
jgi:CheY-like chemotaxis protein